ncbi:DUF4156 domain-containing protein [Bosea sp. NBC_00550]|uniref:DUF4156 domain-containing protein n=1 Tax=Bosea sp. NBC_00550 TaxID=2969621 RepID=UPI0022303397|nr:DUF4156 domain-containing protein [Bosea sp. NBC_00550]UZF90248.1 DUF4156 domain-containing protein [Bosea sp. NBC_00550]
MQPPSQVKNDAGFALKFVRSNSFNPAAISGSGKQRRTCRAARRRFHIPGLAFMAERLNMGHKSIRTARTMAMPRFFILVPALLLGACAYHTSRSSIVVVTDAKGVVENCTKLGEIDGRSDLHSVLLTDTARDSIITRLKIKGAEMGGTHVFSTVADIKWKGPETSGTVYKCNP